MVTVSEIKKILDDAGISGDVEQCSIPYLEELLEEDGSDCYSAKHIFGEDHFVKGARQLFQTAH